MLELGEDTWWKKTIFYDFPTCFLFMFSIWYFELFFQFITNMDFYHFDMFVLYFCKFFVVIDVIVSMTICYNTKHELKHHKKINIYHLTTIVGNEFGGKKFRFYNVI